MVQLFLLHFMATAAGHMIFHFFSPVDHSSMDSICFPLLIELSCRPLLQELLYNYFVQLVPSLGLNIGMYFFFF